MGGVLMSNEDDRLRVEVLVMVASMLQDAVEELPEGGPLPALLLEFRGRLIDEARAIQQPYVDAQEARDAGR